MHRSEDVHVRCLQTGRGLTNSSYRPIVARCLCPRGAASTDCGTATEHPEKERERPTAHSGRGERTGASWLSQRGTQPFVASSTPKKTAPTKPGNCLIAGVRSAAIVWACCRLAPVRVRTRDVDHRPNLVPEHEGGCCSRFRLAARSRTTAFGGWCRSPFSPGQSRAWDP